jgi:hypothetical protein
MPQAGHRRPYRAKNEQGGSPNCWCVPCPSGSGRSQAATPHVNARASPNSPTPSLRRPDNPQNPVVLVTLTLTESEEEAR